MPGLQDGSIRPVIRVDRSAARVQGIVPGGAHPQWFLLEPSAISNTGSTDDPRAERIRGTRLLAALHSVVTDRSWCRNYGRAGSDSTTRAHLDRDFGDSVVLFREVSKP